MEKLISAARPAIGPRDPDAVLTAARTVIAEERRNLEHGAPMRPLRVLCDFLSERLEAPRITPVPSVINATGVILHTNLGRAPWSRAAIQAAVDAAQGYLLLEMDAGTGRRGPRLRLAEERLVALTGAEEALVVTNNAAAVMLATRAAGRGRGVAVSRGQLVEIGGGVRIPEVVRRAGLRLIEVGTTNKTRPEDYAEPLETGRAAAVLHVHGSNFQMVGFVEHPDPADLANIAHRHGAYVVEDLGSGALLDTARYGLAHEPMVQESLRAGADLVTFSGDKLLGGPQAGIIVGRADLMSRIRHDPLARATRPDKVSLVALAATLGAYVAGTAETDLPVWRMIAADAEELRARSHVISARVRAAREHLATEVVPLESTVGGGSLPGETLPSFGVAVTVPRVMRLAAALREGRPAVVSRMAHGQLLLDLRTVSDDEVTALADAMVAAAEP